MFPTKLTGQPRRHDRWGFEPRDNPDADRNKHAMPLSPCTHDTPCESHDKKLGSPTGAETTPQLHRYLGSFSRHWPVSALSVER